MTACCRNNARKWELTRVMYAETEFHQCELVCDISRIGTKICKSSAKRVARARSVDCWTSVGEV